MQQLVTVEFRGDTLFAIEEAGSVFVAVKPICERLGLSWGSQYNRLQRDPLLREGIFVTEIPSPGGAQETTCLALRLVNGWLFGIDIERVKPELREHVLAYKRECYETLADRFLGPRAAERPIQAPEGAVDADIRLREWHERMIAETRRIWGKAAARAQWVQFGYPDHSHLMTASGEMAHEEDACAPDHVVDTLRNFLVERDADLVPAADVGPPDTWARRGIVGFRNRCGDYLLPRDTWNSILGASHARTAGRILAEEGWLVRDTANCLATTCRVGGRTLRVYRVRQAIISEGRAGPSPIPNLPAPQGIF